MPKLTFPLSSLNPMYMHLKQPKTSISATFQSFLISTNKILINKQAQK